MGWCEATIVVSYRHATIIIGIKYTFGGRNINHPVDCCPAILSLALTPQLDRFREVIEASLFFSLSHTFFAFPAQGRLEIWFSLIFWLLPIVMTDRWFMRWCMLLLRRPSYDPKNLGDSQQQSGVPCHKQIICWSLNKTLHANFKLNGAQYKIISFTKNKNSWWPRAAYIRTVFFLSFFSSSSPSVTAGCQLTNIVVASFSPLPPPPYSSQFTFLLASSSSSSNRAVGQTVRQWVKVPLLRLRHLSRSWPYSGSIYISNISNKCKQRVMQI
jgi:hypothetical protein